MGDFESLEDVPPVDHPARDFAHARVKAVRERLLRDGSVTGHDGSTHELFPISISAIESVALRDWVIREEATRTIEIGLAHGISALAICEGLLAPADSAARHVVIDPNQSSYFADSGVQCLEEAGVADIVEHHAEESQIVLPRFLEEGRTFDLAFVDGNHRFDRVFLDLAYLGRLVRPGGVVFADDYQMPAIARAVNFFVQNLDWTVEEDSAADDLHQWVVLRTPTEPDERPFDYFVDF